MCKAQIVTTATRHVHLFEAIVAQVADGIIFADRQGAIQLWNAGAEAIFGYAADETLGQSLELIIPERLRTGPHSTRRSKPAGPKYGRKVMATRSMRKDGTKLYVDLSFALVTTETGAMVGSVAMARDITSRYLADNELRKRVGELQEKIRGLSATSRLRNSSTQIQGVDR
jgi:PAS domain S-box-containing protein